MIMASLGTVGRAGDGVLGTHHIDNLRSEEGEDSEDTVKAAEVDVTHDGVGGGLHGLESMRTTRNGRILEKC